MTRRGAYRTAACPAHLCLFSDGLVALDLHFCEGRALGVERVAQRPQLLEHVLLERLQLLPASRRGRGLGRRHQRRDFLHSVVQPGTDAHPRQARAISPHAPRSTSQRGGVGGRGRRGGKHRSSRAHSHSSNSTIRMRISMRGACPPRNLRVRLVRARQARIDRRHFSRACLRARKSLVNWPDAPFPVLFS